MSGAEIIGVISGVIATVDAVTKLSSAIKDSNGLPTAFRDVHKRLPLVRSILDEIVRSSSSSSSDDAWQVMSPTLESCRDKVERLEVIFNQILPQPVDLRLDRYWKAVRALGKGDTVESLMDGILADCQLLIGLSSMRSLPKDSAEDRKLVGDPDEYAPFPSRGSEYLGENLSYAANFNSGTGTQYIYSGIGTQVNQIGSGAQYNGPVTQYY